MFNFNKLISVLHQNLSNLSLQGLNEVSLICHCKEATGLLAMTGLLGYWYCKR